mmetsp:Transcript_9338/g.34580  ORF Transcript_9338/g.34580 Transcript_9338/m.34580 type:complete len:498 (+) Transcript_9338:233-1726(+)
MLRLKSRFFSSIGLILLLTSILFSTSQCESPQTDPAPFLTAASNHLSNHKYAEALENFSKALPLIYDQKEQLQIHSKRAEIYYLLKKYDMALETLKMIAQKDSSRAADLKMLVQVEMRLGKFDDAVESMRELEKVAPGALRSPSLTQMQDAQRRLKQVRASYQTDPHKCLTELSSLISSYASDALELRLLRAECAILQRAFKIAAAEIKQVLEKEPLNTHALALYAQYLYKLGAIDKAKDTLRRCLTSDPDNKLCMKQHKNIKKGERLLLKAEIKLEDKKWDEAVDRFNQYLELFKDPYNRDEVLGKICNAYLQKKDIKKGIPECTKIVDQMDPGTSTFINAVLDRAELHFLEEDGLEDAEKDINLAETDSQGQEGKRIRSMKQKLERLKRMASRKDYYKILGVPKSATKKEIKKAYRKKAIENHPDRVQGEDDRKKAGKKMRDITEAYEVLSDPDKKRRFDNGEDLDGNGGQGGGFQGHHGFQGGFPGGGEWTFHF